MMDADASQTNEIDLSHIGRLLMRKRRWVIGPTLAALVGSAIFVNVVKPRYSADAKVLLENQESFITRVDKGERAEATAPDAEAVQSQIQLLTSRDLARRVVKTLDLQGNPEFDPLAQGLGPLSRVLVLLGVSRDPTRMSPEDRILEKFADKLTVLSPTKTRVLSIEFSSRSADLAARAANAVADAYLEMQQEAKRANARSAAQALGKLVADLETRAAEADARVEAYRAKTGLLIGANNAVIPTQQLGELNQQLSAARAAQADAQAKARLLRDMLRQNRIGEIPDVANNEVIRRIYEQRVSLRAQLALESRTLLPQHPRIKELTAQLADLDLQWRAAADRTARTLENDARIAASRVENLMQALDDQKRVAGAAGAEEVHLRELERAARLLKEQLETESTKYQEALARDRVKATPADARIIQRALAPQLPSFPKKLPIIALATLATLILTSGAFVAGEILLGRAQLPSRRAPAPPIKLATPLVPQVAADVGAPQETPPGGAAGSFDEVDAAASPASTPAMAVDAAVSADAPQSDADAVTRIDRARVAVECVKVLVALAEGGEQFEKTVIALGRTLSRRGRTLLVVLDRDASGYDSLVAASVDTRPKGASDLIAGEADYADAIHRDLASRLHIMPAGNSYGEARYELSLMVDALAHTYDFLIFAATPETARRLASFVDMAFVLGAAERAEELRSELEKGGVDAFALEEGANVDDLVAA